MSRPPKSEARDLRHGAVEAALALLDEDPDAPLRLSDIADRIGCRPPALYHHFANREALLAAVRAEGFAALADEKRRLAPLAGRDPLARLRAGGRAYAAFALARPGLYRLMFSGTAPAEAGEGAASLELLARAVRSAQAEGHAAGQEAETVALVLWSAVHGLADLLIADRVPGAEGASPDPVALAGAVVDVLVDWIAATRDDRSIFRPD